VLFGLLEFGQVVKLKGLAVDTKAHIALGLHVGKHVQKLAFFLARQRGQNHQAGVFGQGQRGIHHLTHSLTLQGQAVFGAMRGARAGKQQAQVVVDLGHRAHGGARVVAGGFLLDADGRRQALNHVHIRLVHHLQELSGVGAQALHIAALAFGIQRVKRQAGLARPAQSRNHHQLVARDVDVDVFQVVRACTPDADVLQLQSTGQVGAVGRSCQSGSRLRETHHDSKEAQQLQLPAFGGGEYLRRQWRLCPLMAPRRLAGAHRKARQTHDNQATNLEKPMASVNKVILVGNCGRDPEIRYLPSGQAVANVSVATSTRRKDKNTGESIESTEWHRVTFYDRLAEIAGEYVKKGRPIYVEGRLKYGKYTDQSGIEKNTVDIVATELQLLGGREGMGGPGDSGEEGGAPPPRRPMAPSRAAAPAAAPRQAPAPRPASGFDDMDDDIPF
jgi:single-strand DNA-binding protein